MKNLLSIKNLTVAVKENSNEKLLLDGVSLNVPENSIVGLVGASGSGKTTAGLSILRLLPLGLNIKKGEALFSGEDLFSLSEKRMRQIRGKDIGMIFQEPLNAFNPVFSIGYQIDEVLRFHTRLTSGQRKQKIMELLNIVGINEPERIANNYSHQLSGGLRQRAMIAQAIAAEPKLIIADEPTSNLDVTLQATIIELFLELRKRLRLSIILITHDLGMVSHLADEVAVMTNGKIVEEGKTKEILSTPKHKYTQELMEALVV